MRKLVHAALLLFASLALGTAVLSAQARSAEAGADGQHADELRVRKLVESPYFEGLYARTYWSLVQRTDPGGFVPESLTGAYGGMFPRTIGALSLLYLETGRLDEAEKSIACVLRAMEQNHQEMGTFTLGTGGV